MGLNKRILTMENIKLVYNTYGYEGLSKYVEKPDILFTDSDGSDKIVEIIKNDNCLTSKILKIEKIIYGL